MLYINKFKNLQLVIWGVEGKALPEASVTIKASMHTQAYVRIVCAYVHANATHTPRNNGDDVAGAHTETQMCNDVG